jgi:hypothetical protein
MSDRFEPGWLAPAAALFVAHGLYKHLFAETVAERHRLSRDTGEERFYEHAPRSPDPAAVAREGLWEIALGAVLFADAALIYLFRL